MQEINFYPVDEEYENKVRNSFSAQLFMKTLGASLTKVIPGYCEIKLPYKPELTQHDGYFHAGTVGTIADNAAGYAAFTLMPEGSSVLTTEYKLNLLTPGYGEYLIARGKVIKPGRTLTICQSEVSAVGGDGVEKLCALAIVTLICIRTNR